DPLAAESIQEALESALGVLIVVDKVRRVGIWRRTRIHIDVVDHLGAFVELETITAGDEDPTASVELDEIARRLGLNDFPPIAGSYSDLLLSTTGCGPPARDHLHRQTAGSFG